MTLNSLNHLSRIFINIMAVVLFFVMGSCGSGSGNGSTSNNGGGEPVSTDTPVPTTTLRTTVSLDSSISAEIANSIINVVSPSEKASLGSPVTISTASPSGESILLALNANNTIVLASITTSSPTVLSADSTALAISRLAIGSIPTGFTSVQINTLIRNAGEYPNLVELITKALGAGVPPIIVPDVLQSVATVISQVGSEMSATLSNTGIGAPKIRKSVTPPPFTLIKDPNTFLGLGGVVIVGSGGASEDKISLKNDMVIPWHAETSFSEGGIIAETTLPGSFGPYLINTGQTEISGIRGKTFKFRINQTPDTHAEIEVDVITRSIDIALSFLPGGCDYATLKATSKSLSKSHIIVSNPTAEQIKAFADSFIFDPENMSEILESCGEKGAFLLAEVLIPEFLAPINEFLSALSKIKDTFYSTPFIYNEIKTAVTYWTRDETFTVCEDERGNIINCTAIFKFTPDILLAAVGVNLREHTKIAAFDADGDQTAIPSNLVYTSTKQDVIDVTANTGDAITTKAENALVIVTDPSTGAHGSYAVKVVDPGILSPNPLTMNVGETRLLTLTDEIGNPIIPTPGTTIDENSFNHSIIGINPLATLITNKFQVTALKAGQTDIALKNPITGKLIPAKINVIDKTPIAISYNFLLQACQRATGECTGVDLVAPNPVELKFTHKIASNYLPNSSSEDSSTGIRSVAVLTDRSTSEYNVYNDNTVKIYDPIVCKVGDKWIPAHHDWNHTFHYPYLSSGYLPGSEEVLSMKSSFDLTSDGKLTTTWLRSDVINTTYVWNLGFPANEIVDVNHSDNTTDETATTNLNDGSGSYVYKNNYTTRFDETCGSTYPPGYCNGLWSQSDNIGTGNSEWPPETTSPPKLPGVRLQPLRSYYSGDTLPPECLP